MLSAAALGYLPNVSARAVAKRGSDTVALIVGDIADPHFSSLTARVLRRADETGLIVTIGINGRSVAQVERGLAAGHRLDDIEKLFATNDVMAVGAMSRSQRSVSGAFECPSRPLPSRRANADPRNTGCRKSSKEVVPRSANRTSATRVASPRPEESPPWVRRAAGDVSGNREFMWRKHNATGAGRICDITTGASTRHSRVGWCARSAGLLPDA